MIASTFAAEVQFRPSTAVLQEILSSGKLDVFRNKELKRSLASWIGLMQKMVFQEENEHGRLRTQFIDHLMDEAGFRRIAVDRFGDLFG